MRMKRAVTIVALAWMPVLLFGPGCSRKTKTVFFFSSVKRGSASADSAFSGVRSVLSARKDMVLRYYFMEGPSDSFRQDSVKKALRLIRKSRPRVLIAYGDDAVKYIVGPHFRNKPLPVVFFGIQWACDQYGLPAANTTGMLDVPPLRQIVQRLKPYYRNLRTMAVISENANSAKRNRKYIDGMLRPVGIRTDHELVDGLGGWKAAFIRANTQADLICLTDARNLAGWKDAAMAEFVYSHIQKPVVTCDEAMMRFAVFGITRMTRETGEWAGRTAAAIIDGTDASDIPITESREAAAILNSNLARRIELRPDREFLETVFLYQSP
jgi:ABC-type uncharacterized transport system substrate-binding protein